MTSELSKLESKLAEIDRRIAASVDYVWLEFLQGRLEPFGNGGYVTQALPDEVRLPESHRASQGQL